MLRGRRGHARAVVLTVVDQEFNAVLAEFPGSTEVRGSACWSPRTVDVTHPVLIAQSIDRSNIPSAETVHDLIEDWRPEVIVVCGVAGGIARLRNPTGNPTGPLPGDVICVEYVHYGEYTKNVNGEQLRRYFPLQHPSAEAILRHVKPIARTEWYEDLPCGKPENTHGRPAELQFGELVAVEFLAGDASAEHQRRVLEQYDHALAVDMESAGVARAMHRASNDVHYHPTWLCLRGISDRTAATIEAQDAIGADNNGERERWREYAAATAARVTRLAIERMLEAPRPAHEGDPGAPAWASNGDAMSAERGRMDA